ncbi:hypothetical protein [Microbulbifer discodermiae]|uniref:hypothetical protein n=1 Tax=Microbulbifer sp. 2201CG32-9 TaxID=3232309 RepID=UPI00345B9F00
MRPILTIGEPRGALDSLFVGAKQSPLIDPNDPYAMAMDDSNQRAIEAEDRIAKLKGDKLGGIGRMLSAMSAGYHGRDPSRVFAAHNARLDQLQAIADRNRQRAGDLNLQKVMQEQKAMAAEVEVPAAVREYQYWKALPPEEQEKYLTLRRDTIERMGNQLYNTAGGKPVEMLSDEQLQQILRDRANTKAAEVTAGEEARNQANREDLAKTNRTAFSAYQAAVDGLSKGLEGTTTNPIAGRFPAFSAGAQIADGAISAMAPILKSLFRESGEGTFTDKDQELLIEMLPTRKDHPEARRAKIEMVDSIVRAKLGIDRADIQRDAFEAQADTRNTNSDPLGIR